MDPENKNLPEKSDNSSSLKEDDHPKPDAGDNAVKDGDKLAETEKEIKEAAEEEETEKKADEENVEETVAPDPYCDLEKVSEEIDRFLLTLSAVQDEDEASVEISEFVAKFLDLVEDKIRKYESGEATEKWGQAPEEDSIFLESTGRISNLTVSFHKCKSDSKYEWLSNRIGGIHQRAMSILEDEFKSILEDSRNNNESDPGGDSKSKQEKHENENPESEQVGDQDDFPGFSETIVYNLKKIAKEMISGGYESECCEVYIIVRRHAFEERLNKLGFEKLSIDEVQKMQWEALEREIPTWIMTFKQCANLYFSGEKNLAEALFSENPSISSSLFSNLTRNVLIQLLNFAEAISMTKRAAEKLFKFLDMYEALRDSAPAMENLFSEDCQHELTTARCRLGEAVIRIFCELENSIKSDAGKTPVPGGAVHPLTRYTMNYLKLACEYKDTLEHVFKEHSKIERADSTSRHDYEGDQSQTYNNSNNQTPNQSPFSVQLLRVMDFLDSNLESKSKIYRDNSLSNIFMMNNGRYILQKVKGSPIHSLMGDTWSRRRSSELRTYHKNYQRETWNKLLGCLGHEGLSVNGKVVKPVLKERFKSFNAMFDEIHKTQSTWVVSDEQLQSELRVSISAVVIPAYRSFLGRFAQTLDPGRQTEKYVKYQPEDIETHIDELFDGNANAAGAKRKP